MSNTGSTRPGSEREEALFAAALQRPTSERAAFLDGACHGDAALRARLEVLLAADERPNELLGDDAASPEAKANLRSNPAESPAQMLGRYKLLEKIGEGGFGEVWMAEQREPVKRRVALKIIKLGMDSRQIVARFEAERQALAMMDHPNIAKIFDADVTDSGRPYFVMELVRGIKITEYCDQNQLPTKNRLGLFIKVCQAIQHAHQKGIIHRDIKPSNILVTLHDGVPVPKVIDFGIAKATQAELTDKTVFTQFQQFIGTPAYISPEQAEMSGLDIDTRADIYSLGVLLYELLVGQTPFDAKEMMKGGIDALVRIIREREPMRPSTKLNTLPGDARTTAGKRRQTDVNKLVHQLQGDLDWIVMKCLEKDRTRRHDTANGLSMDIQRHLNNEPVVARPPSTPYKIQKAWQRNKLIFSAATAVALALIAGIAASSWQTFAARKAQRETEAARRGEETQRREAQQKQSEAESEKQRADVQARKASESQQRSRRLLYASDMNLAQQSLKQNNLGKARLLLERHRPISGEEDLRGWEWRYLWQQAGNGALTTLTNRSTRGFDVSFSPDGDRLAVAWLDGQVELWDVTNRRLTRVLSTGDQLPFGHVAFSPVGNLLAATSARNTVTLYHLDSSQESIAWQMPEQERWVVTDLSFSRDGSRLLVYAALGPASDGVWVIDVDSGKIESRHETFRGPSQFHGAAELSPDNRRLYITESDVRNYRCTIQCFDITNGEELWRTEPCSDYGLTALAMSPDGAMLVSGSGFEDPAIRVWDARTGKLLFRLEGHTGWVCDLAFTRDGRRLFSAASDQTIRVWDVKSWTETRVLRGHSDEVHSVAISAKNGLVASASKDGRIMLWRDDEKAGKDGYLVLPETYRDAVLTPLGQSRLLLASPGGRNRLLDLRESKSPSTRPELMSPTRRLGSFGAPAAARSADTPPLCYWDGTNQILIVQCRETNFVKHGSFELNTGAVPRAFAFNMERDLIAWTEAGGEKAIYVANLKTPGRRTELKNDLPGTRILQFSVAGDFLGARDSSGLRAWQLETGRVVASIDESVIDFVFAAGGHVLGVSVPVRQGRDHEIRFYDLRNPEGSPRTFPGKDISRSIVVSPDGRLVAVSTDGGQLMLFDPVKGELIASMRGHLNAAFRVAFSPDGRRLISSSGGREAIKVWDVETRQELLTLPGAGSFLSLAFWGPDGNEIVARQPPQAWQVWHAPSWEQIAAAGEKEKAMSQQP